MFADGTWFDILYLLQRQTFLCDLSPNTLELVVDNKSDLGGFHPAELGWTDTRQFLWQHLLL